VTVRPLSLFALAGVTALACANDEVVLFELPATQIGENGGTAGSGVTSTGGTETGGAATGGSTTGGAGAGGEAASGGAPGTGGKGAPPFGGMPGGFGDPCGGDEDCPSTSFCQMPDCAATVGFCVPRQVFCVDDHAEAKPVCGCNGITYWNECERQRAGERSQSFGECGVNARSCEAADDCGSSAAFCAKLTVPVDRCGDFGAGICWVLPESCRGESKPWVECLEQPPMPGMPLPELECVNTCTAIRSERPHFLAGRRCEMSQ
jgi:hypothetical protein